MNIKNKRSNNLIKIVSSALLAILLVGGYYLINTYQKPTQTMEWGPLEKAPEEVVGKTIILRTLKERYFIDFHNMFSLDVRQSLEFPEHIDLDYTIRFLRYEMGKNAAGEQLMYCVFDAKENILIGGVEVRELKEGDPGQFGCWLNERYRGGGRIQEAIQLISNIYFRLHRVDSFNAHVRIWNKRSYYALLKGGFKDTGTFFYEDGKPERYILEYYRPKAA